MRHRVLIVDEDPPAARGGRLLPIVLQSLAEAAARAPAADGGADAPDGIELVRVRSTAEALQLLERDHQAERIDLVVAPGPVIDGLRRRNGELKAMATRVADAFLRRLDGDSTSGVHEVLAAAAAPTLRTAASALLGGLQRARERLREGHPDETLDLLVRDSLAEARRIVSLLEQIEEISR